MLANRRLGDYLLDPDMVFVAHPSGVFSPLSSDYAEQRLVLRILNERWKELGTLSQERREEHRSAFFREVVDYRPIAKRPSRSIN